jgi:hypothetical protein
LHKAEGRTGARPSGGHQRLEPPRPEVPEEPGRLDEPEDCVPPAREAELLRELPWSSSSLRPRALLPERLLLPEDSLLLPRLEPPRPWFWLLAIFDVLPFIAVDSFAECGFPNRPAKLRAGFGTRVKISRSPDCRVTCDCA